ncbi:MAG: hypothetical protein GY711_22735 [bacterium]|nr:hypothetical protein [bacterium]
MSRFAKAFALCAGLVALGGSCGDAPVWPPSPSTLLPGQESCAGCRMFVSDPRFAAQRHARDGSLEWFDDVGCLVEKHGPDVSDPEGVFVHAFEGADWLRADSGHVVRTADIDSPMGHGWCAYATLEQARAAAARHADAELLPITDLLRGGAAGSHPRSPDRNPETPKRN